MRNPVVGFRQLFPALTLLSAASLFAGREIPVAPGDKVFAEQVVVRLTPGAEAGTVARGLGMMFSSPHRTS